jgi:hypothetical protein
MPLVTFHLDLPAPITDIPGDQLAGPHIELSVFVNAPLMVIAGTQCLTLAAGLFLFKRNNVGHSGLTEFVARIESPGDCAVV